MAFKISRLKRLIFDISNIAEFIPFSAMFKPQKHDLSMVLALINQSAQRLFSAMFSQSNKLFLPILKPEKPIISLFAIADCF